MQNTKPITYSSLLTSHNITTYLTENIDYLFWNLVTQSIVRGGRIKTSKKKDNDNSKFEKEND